MCEAAIGTALFTNTLEIPGFSIQALCLGVHLLVVERVPTGTEMRQAALNAGVNDLRKLLLSSKMMMMISSKRTPVNRYCKALPKLGGEPGWQAAILMQDCEVPTVRYLVGQKMREFYESIFLLWVIWFCSIINSIVSSILLAKRHA